MRKFSWSRIPTLRTWPPLSQFYQFHWMTQSDQLIGAKIGVTTRGQCLLPLDWGWSFLQTMWSVKERAQPRRHKRRLSGVSASKWVSELAFFKCLKGVSSRNKRGVESKLKMVKLLAVVLYRCSFQFLKGHCLVLCFKCLALSTYFSTY